MRDIRCWRFLPALRYASAGTSCGPASVCVCLSQLGVLSKLLDESGWFLVWELSTYPTLCCKEIRVSSEIRVLPSGTLFQTLDLENFATAYRSSKRVINFAREKGGDAQSMTTSVNKVDNTSEFRRSTAVVYRTDRQALSTARQLILVSWFLPTVAQTRQLTAVQLVNGCCVAVSGSSVH